MLFSATGHWTQDFTIAFSLRPLACRETELGNLQTREKEQTIVFEATMSGMVCFTAIDN